MNLGIHTSGDIPEIDVNIGMTINQNATRNIIGSPTSASIALDVCADRVIVDLRLFEGEEFFDKASEALIVSESICKLLTEVNILVWDKEEVLSITNLMRQSGYDFEELEVFIPKKSILSYLKYLFWRIVGNQTRWVKALMDWRDEDSPCIISAYISPNEDLDDTLNTIVTTSDLNLQLDILRRKALEVERESWEEEDDD
jgi:hypothetical protein